MEYTELLNQAFAKVKQTGQECDRFEIKKPETHIEGNKTIIDNFAQIVHCIKRDQAHFTKFLFKELASAGEISGDRLILTNKISINKITEKIQMYINKYVICPNCKKPDTTIMEEAGQKYLRCMACGNKIKLVD